FVVNPITSEWVGISKPKGSILDRKHVGFTARVDPETGVVDGAFEFDGKLFWVDLSVWDVKDNDYFECVESDEVAVCRLWRCLWRLKDCEVGGEWSLMSRENVQRILTCERRNGRGRGGVNLMPKPCFVHPFEADVAYFETGDCIFSFNLRTQKVGNVGGFTPHEYVLPFVLSKWPSPIPKRLFTLVQPTLDHLKWFLDSILMATWLQMSDMSHKTDAAYAKEEGNECFKSQNFTKAIECYSEIIDLSPNSATFANRGMAHLKVNKYQEAENDCTKSLKLDANYFKVYWRRALARKELGNLKGALEDVELGLMLEPKNGEVKKLRTELKSMLEKIWLLP
ncbi:hypothetical protein KSS87_001303, partial [Heliosperma pusillum]